MKRNSDDRIRIKGLIISREGSIIIPTKYLFFFLSKKLSMQKIVSTNKMNVRSCARAAIKSCIKYIISIVSINDISGFLLIFDSVI